MEKNLYNLKVLKENGSIDFFRDVKASINDSNQLVIHCCDINNTANLLYGDSGVEFYLIIDKKNKAKLASALNSKLSFIYIYPRVNYTDQSLINSLYIKFGEKYSCFKNIMDFLKKHRINYEYQRW